MNDDFETNGEEFDGLDNEEFEVITLSDSDTGEEEDFIVLRRLTKNENTYVLLVKDEGDDDISDDAGAVLCKQTPCENGDIYEPIDNEEEFNEIRDLLLEDLSNMFEFEDDDDEDWDEDLDVWDDDDEDWEDDEDDEDWDDDDGNDE